jgi:hypothetical protein
VGQAFFAPVFFIMMWVVFTVMGNGFSFGGSNFGTGQGVASWNSFVAGAQNPGAFRQQMALLLNFFVTLGLLIAALTVARTIAGQAGEKAIKLNRYVTAGGLGVIGFAGRNTAGRLAYKASESEGFKEAASKNRVAALGLKATQKAAGGTFDARNSRTFRGVATATGLDFGSGREAGEKAGGYKDGLNRYTKAETDFANSLGKGEASQLVIDSEKEARRDIETQNQSLKQKEEEVKALNQDIANARTYGDEARAQAMETQKESVVSEIVDIKEGLEGTKKAQEILAAEVKNPRKSRRAASISSDKKINKWDRLFTKVAQKKTKAGEKIRESYRDSKKS